MQHGFSRPLLNLRFTFFLFYFSMLLVSQHVLAYGSGSGSGAQPTEITDQEIDVAVDVTLDVASFAYLLNFTETYCSGKGYRVDTSTQKNAWQTRNNYYEAYHIQAYMSRQSAEFRAKLTTALTTLQTEWVNSLQGNEAVICARLSSLYENPRFNRHLSNPAGLQTMRKLHQALGSPS